MCVDRKLQRVVTVPLILAASTFMVWLEVPASSRQLSYCDRRAHIPPKLSDAGVDFTLNQPANEDDRIFYKTGSPFTWCNHSIHAVMYAQQRALDLSLYSMLQLLGWAEKASATIDTEINSADSGDTALESSKGNFTDWHTAQPASIVRICFLSPLALRH